MDSGRPCNTAYELFGSLLDMGQYDLAANVMAMQIEVEDHEDRHDSL